jgi:hypothetical protein
MSLPAIRSADHIKTNAGYDNDSQSNEQARGKGKAPKTLPIDPVSVINGNPANATPPYFQLGVEPI